MISESFLKFWPYTSCFTIFPYLFFYDLLYSPLALLRYLFLSFFSSHPPSSPLADVLLRSLTFLIFLRTSLLIISTKNPRVSYYFRIWFFKSFLVVCYSSLNLSISFPFSFSIMACIPLFTFTSHSHSYYHYLQQTN